jgi:hypothetical protein
MQPYSYAVYPTPNGATMPVYHTPPTYYQQSSVPYANQSSVPYANQSSVPYANQSSVPYANQTYDNYAAIPSTGPANQYAPYPLYYPATGMPPRPMMPSSSQFQQPPGYYYVSNGGYQAVPSNSQSTKHVPERTNTQNQAMQGMMSNSNTNDLSNHKGTKGRMSKNHRIKNKDDSNDDEYESIPLYSSRSQICQQSAAHNPRPASSCSRCSTCSNCSCSECRHENRKHVYDNCPQCRAEWERAKNTNRSRRKK